MKKTFNKLLAATCLCTTLMTPIASFAAQPVMSGAYDLCVAAAAEHGHIVGNGVYLRANGTMIPLGTLDNNDDFDVIGGTTYYQGRAYQKVKMTSGRNKGKEGWVCKDYLHIC